MQTNKILCKDNAFNLILPIFAEILDDNFRTVAALNRIETSAERA